MGQLSLTVALGEREGALSWSKRLAARNHCRLDVFCTDLGLDLRGIASGKPEHLAPLASLGGEELQIVTAWTPREQGAKTMAFRGMLFRQGIFRATGPRFCPECWREDIDNSKENLGAAIVERSDWQFAFTFVCIKHSRYLLQSHKLPDVEEIARLAQPEPIAITAFDTWCFQRLSVLQTSNWLDQFDFQASLDLCELIGRRLHYEDHAYVRVSTKASAIAEGFALLSQGPRALRGCFDRWFRKAGANRHLPQAVFGGLYTSLQEIHTGPNHAPFRKILRQYILDKMPVSAGTVLLGQPVTRRRFHTVTSAAHEAGITVNRMQAILHKHKKMSPSQTGRMAILKISISQEISEQTSRAVSRGQIQESLQILARDFDALVAARLIKPVYEIESNRQLWSLAESTDLLERLLSRAAAIEEADKERLYLRQVARRLCIPYGSLIWACAEGQFTSLSHIQGNRTLRELRVDIGEARKLFNKPS